MNSFGQYFRIHTFGESHGEALGVVIDGCPAGVSWDQGLLVKNLMRRRPGQSQIVSSRNETEDVRILSGVYQGQTLGTPIALTVFNQDARSQDYVNDHGEKTFNPRSGHADDMWSAKFGHSDFRGGGRSSGRETISRVMAGSVAQMLVRQLQPETEVLSFVETIGSINLDKNELIEFGKNPNKSQFVESFHTRIPNVEKDRMATELLIKAKEQGQSYGGIARVQIVRPSKNLGQPVFKKIKSELASAFMSVGAVTGVELGIGFSGVHIEGTEFHNEKNSNFYGGIRGGIGTGEDIYFRVAFKPTSSVMDVAKKGRHDPCIVPRAVVVLEAMTYIVLADLLLAQRLDKVL